MLTTHRVAYLALTAGITVVAGTAAVTAGADPASVVTGLMFAWSMQAASFWPLAGALEAGRPVTVPWVAGMAARIGGLAALWAFTAVADRGRDVVLAYAFALVTYLLLEAVWLAVVSRGTVPGIGDR